jgi:hypothetical protein
MSQPLTIFSTAAVRCGWIACCLSVLALASLLRAADTPADVEAKLKSAFILNFARYVDWPPNAFASTNSPLLIGVLGQDTLGPHLDATVQGRSVGPRTVQVVRGTRVAEVQNCHVLFVASSEQDRFRTILRQLGNRPVLTVGDWDGFTDDGGVIGLKKRQSTMRFEINREAAERVGLKVSSRLLKLGENFR